ncbi:hypothetical protein RIF23_02340 [Lipingzhangella sp. LS1_29]|uniref:DUF222 domain-containing protein n=1 Tax=Lipingzhangella rawalii TaxID=2055835 RepID=A0ABU2H1G0_9ACTN|nr:hypothetical protein [Lipingzhangella rawalii]MDS1269131.1 hypothetical protein [Lipingzhangella rawalii]
MSFAIAVRWVSVQGQRTSYAEVVDEAAHLRGELAQLRARAAALRESGTIVQELPQLPDLVALKGEPALIEWVEWTRHALPELRSHLDDTAHQTLAARLGASLPPPRTRPSATEELAQLRQSDSAASNTPEAATPHRHPARARQHALESVRHLLADAAAELDPHAHRDLAARLNELHQLDDTSSVATIREAHHAVVVTLNRALQQHRSQLHREVERAQLLGQLADVSADTRAYLHAQIGAADDPGAWRPHVDHARAAAENQRLRTHLAQAATQALTAVGCDVTDIHTTTLTSTGETVCPLPDQDGYGIRVRLPPDRNQLSASLVRDTHTTPSADEDAGRWFCTHTEPTFYHALCDHTEHLHLHQRLRVEPGDRPLPQVRLPATDRDRHDEQHEPEQSTTDTGARAQQRHH